MIRKVSYLEKTRMLVVFTIVSKFSPERHIGGGSSYTGSVADDFIDCHQFEIFTFLRI